MVRIFENETLESVMARPNLPELFTIIEASITSTRHVESIVICLFDKKGVLHVVDAIDQEEPDTYHLVVPFTCEHKLLRGILDTDVMLDEENKLIFEDYRDRDLRVCKKDRGFSTAGMTLLAKSKCYSPCISKTLKEIIEKMPFEYRFGEPKNRLDDFFVGFDPKQINVKSEIKERYLKHIRELNIFPLVAQLTNDHNVRCDLFMTSVDAVFGACLITFFLGSNKDEDVRSSAIDINYFSVIGAYLLLKSFGILSCDLFVARYGTFNRCRKALDKMSKRNMAISAAGELISEEDSLLFDETIKNRKFRSQSTRKMVLCIDNDPEMRLRTAQERIEAVKSREEAVKSREEAVTSREEAAQAIIDAQATRQADLAREQAAIAARIAMRERLRRAIVDVDGLLDD